MRDCRRDGAPRFERFAAVAVFHKRFSYGALLDTLDFACTGPSTVIDRH